MKRLDIDIQQAKVDSLQDDMLKAPNLETLLKVRRKLEVEETKLAGMWTEFNKQSVEPVHG